MAPQADINMHGSTARTFGEDDLDDKGAMEKIDEGSSTSDTVDPMDLAYINEKSDVPRGSCNNSMSASFPQLNASSPIKHFDLDFDTVIPPTSHQSSLKDDCSSPPPQPDLKKFVSPFSWSKTRKNLTMVLCCCATMTSAYSAGSFSPASAAMMSSWNVSAMYVSFGITAFCIGFAIMPMVLAPFSELRGRYPVFWICGLLFTGSQIGCALVQTYHGMIIFRFLVGCSSSVFASVVGGVVSDLYHAKDRNAPMAVYSGAALLATGLGPFISGPMVERVGWRWPFWLQVVMDGLLALSFLLFFSETRGSVLLTRKAAALNMWYEARERAGYYGVDVVLEDGTVAIDRVRWTVRADKERESLYALLQTSVTRPFSTCLLLPTPPLPLRFLLHSLPLALLCLSLSIQFPSSLSSYRSLAKFPQNSSSMSPLSSSSRSGSPSAGASST
jgi:MFS family permease